MADSHWFRFFNSILEMESMFFRPFFRYGLWILDKRLPRFHFNTVIVDVGQEIFCHKLFSLFSAKWSKKNIHYYTSLRHRIGVAKLQTIPDLCQPMPFVIFLQKMAEHRFYPTNFRNSDWGNRNFKFSGLSHPRTSSGQNIVDHIRANIPVILGRKYKWTHRPPFDHRLMTEIDHFRSLSWSVFCVC